jgi:ornithine carbamoyltransferase
MALNYFKQPIDSIFKNSSLRGRDLLTLSDLSSDEILDVIKAAQYIKHIHLKGEAFQPIKGKTLGMIFYKSSTRTRISFEVAMWQLGGYALYLNQNDLQLKRGETVQDTARVLSRYLDGIMIRTFSHKDVEKLAQFADIPIINGLTDFCHPCQVLADLLTVYEKKQSLAGLKLAYIGDGNNMAHSLLYGCSKIGMDIYIASPKGYMPQPEVVADAKKNAALSSSKVVITSSVDEAAEGADVLYTDVWTSMGQEEETQKRKAVFSDFQINSHVLKSAKKDVIVMHCLPAHRGEEITDDVIEGPNSVVFDEAENRLHVQKAILALML